MTRMDWRSGKPLRTVDERRQLEEDKRNEMIGEVFGYLTIIGWEQTTHGGLPRWKVRVRCVCKREKLVMKASLTSGRTKTCRNTDCLRLLPLRPRKHRPPEYMIGRRYGTLTVIGLHAYVPSHRPHNDYKALCRCDCGAETLVQVGTLKGGRTLSCGASGCRPAMALGKHSKMFKGYEEITGKYWSGILIGAASRELEADITLEYAWSLFVAQGGRCAYTGWSIFFEQPAIKGRRERCSGTASLDRIDNSRGYVEGNVQWVHKDVNRSRMNFSEERYIEMSQAVTAYRKGKS